MVIWERIVVDAVVHLAVGVSGAFGAELPDGPVGAMFAVEPVYERVERVAVRALGVCAAGARGRDD